MGLDQPSSQDGENIVLDDSTVNASPKIPERRSGIDNKLSVNQGSTTNYFLADQPRHYGCSHERHRSDHRFADIRLIRQRIKRGISFSLPIHWPRTRPDHRPPVLPSPLLRPQNRPLHLQRQWGTDICRDATVRWALFARQNSLLYSHECRGSHLNSR